MRQLRLITLIAGMLLAFTLLFPARSTAQESSATRFQTGLDYNFVRTNAPPGGCGCFSLNGGNGWAAYQFSGAFAIVGEVSAQHATNVLGSGTNVTLVSYLFGPRYSFPVSKHFVLFAQTLLGDSTLRATASSNSNAFAMTLGGGLDVRLNRHFTVRAAQVDYFFTHFDNGVNDHQNNLRVTTGLSYRF
ncbi:MAG: outer membrane beta-barrel protein [Candidatus Acidiferrum sp.]